MVLIEDELCGKKVSPHSKIQCGMSQYNSYHDKCCCYYFFILMPLDCCSKNYLLDGSLSVESVSAVCDKSLKFGTQN